MGARAILGMNDHAYHANVPGIISFAGYLGVKASCTSSTGGIHADAACGLLQSSRTLHMMLNRQIFYGMQAWAPSMAWPSTRRPHSRATLQSTTTPLPLLLAQPVPVQPPAPLLHASPAFHMRSCLRRIL